MKTNYLIYFCNGISSVFDSQVITLLKAIQDKNIFKKTYLFLGIRNEKQKNEFLTREAHPEIEIVFFKSYPNYPFFNFFNRKSIKNALKSQSINLKEVIFHTRGEMLVCYLGKILGANYYKNILPDVRGASVEEIEEFADSNEVLKSLKILNNKKAIRSVNKFHKISVVSYSLKEYLINNYNIDQEKIVVTPCLAGPDFRYDDVIRESTRNEMNLSKEDKVIVFSSGGLANWQNVSVLTKLAEKGFKVLNLSKKNISHRNVINRFNNYNEMPHYLNAADVAIIWRNESIVNKVASPVKFSEFVCCGLPVISNRSVDMISEFITRNMCGLLLESIDDLDMNTINNFNQNDRKRISESAILNFGIDTIVNQYLKTYALINNL